MRKIFNHPKKWAKRALCLAFVCCFALAGVFATAQTGYAAEEPASTIAKVGGNGGIFTSQLNGVPADFNDEQYSLQMTATVADVGHSHTIIEANGANATCDTEGPAEQFKSTQRWALFSDELGENTVTSECSHDFGEWEDARPMTCIRYGVRVKYRECKNCYKYFDENGNKIDNPFIPLDPNAHAFGEWQEEVPATCIKEGMVAHKKCIHCSAFFDENGEYIPYEDRFIPKNPDNHAGTVTYKWGDKYTHMIDATCCGVKYVSHTGGTATCQQLATCEICGFEYGNKADHSFSADWSYDNIYHYKKCEQCDVRNNNDRHTIQYDDGHRICSDCGYDATLITSISFNVEKPKPGETPSTATNVVTTPADVVYIHEWGWNENNASEDPTVFEDKKQYYFYVVFKANVGL